MPAGSWCWSSTAYSLAVGHSRCGLNLLTVPRLKPVDGPSSFNCAIESPLRSLHDRVSLASLIGLTWLRRLVPIWTRYRLNDATDALNMGRAPRPTRQFSERQ